MLRRKRNTAAGVIEATLAAVAAADGGSTSPDNQLYLEGFAGYDAVMSRMYAQQLNTTTQQKKEV
jgi:hypothetical protein